VRRFEFALDEAAKNKGIMQRGWINLPVVVLD
jgi:hypothetical protein